MIEPSRRATRRVSLVAVSLACLALLLGAPGRAENWPQWRGPYFNGSTTETNLPTQWSKTENVAWVAPLPGQAARRRWFGRRAFSSPARTSRRTCSCFAWIGRPARCAGRRWWPPGTGKAGRNNAASPSPVTDGKRVFVLFATGDLAAFDFAGQELWKRNLAKEYGRFANMWMYGSSPMLYGGKLYVQVLQSNPRPDDYTPCAGRPARTRVLPAVPRSADRHEPLAARPPDRCHG